MPRCAEQPKESSTAHAKVEVAIATFLKFVCVMDLTPLFFCLLNPQIRRAASQVGLAATAIA
jgi:hypothetical protein